MERKKTREKRSSRFGVVGLDDNGVGHWHTLFERENPSGCQSFQEWLGLPEERIAMVRSKTGESRK